MRDYTRRNNASSVVMEVVYNVNSKAFTCKRRSELVFNGRLAEDVKSILIPRFDRKVKIDVTLESNFRLGQFDRYISILVELPLEI